MELGIISVSSKCRHSLQSSEKNKDHRFQQRNIPFNPTYGPLKSYSSSNLSDESTVSATSSISASGYGSLNDAYPRVKKAILGELSFCNSTDSDEIENECFCDSSKRPSNKFVAADRPTIFNDYRNSINNNNMVNIKCSGVDNKINNMKAISLVNQLNMPYNRLPSFDSEHL
jgi:hypothetical protein